MKVVVEIVPLAFFQPDLESFDENPCQPIASFNEMQGYEPEARRQSRLHPLLSRPTTARAV